MGTIAATLSTADCAGMTWDALVIGAGPAGAYTAIVLARAGVKTLLVERRAFSRRKVCGGCLNVAAVAMLDRLGLVETVCAAGAERLCAVQLRCGGRAARIALPGGLALSREMLDATLVREAIASGCAFLPETAAQVRPTGAHDPASPESPRHVMLVPRLGVSQVTRALLVVAADGLSHPSLDACPEFRGIVSPCARIGVGGLTRREAVECPDGTITMAVGRGGYVGLVGVEHGQLNIAAAFDPGFLRERRSPSVAIREILVSARVPVRGPLDAVDFQGTPPLTQQSRTVAGHRVVLVGDAAGYVEPFTGEGMAWAFAAAARLPPIALRARQAWTAALEQEWSAAHAAIVGRKQRWCRALAAVIRIPALVGPLVAGLGIFPRAARPFFAHIERPIGPTGVLR